MNQTKLKSFLTPAYLETFLFSLLLLLLPTQLGKHFWPDFSQVYSLRIDYLAITVYFWDILVYLLLMVAAFQRRAFNKSAGLLLLGFLICSSLSLFSPNWGVSLARLINWIPAGLFGWYIASQNSERVKQKILSILPLTILYTTLIGLWQFVFGRTAGLWFLGERTFDLTTPGIATFNWYGQIFLRSYATFPHPNVLAAFMLLSGLLLLFLSNKNNKKLLVAHLAVILTILMTFSRTVTGLYLPFVLFLFRKQSVYLGFLIIFLAPLLFVRFESAFNFDKLSLIRREELTENAFLLIQQNPVVGVGLNNYIPVAVSSSFLTGTNRFLQPVHNIFLLMMVETGLVGLIALLILFIVPLIMIGSDNLLTKQQVLTLLLVISILGMLDHYFLTLPQGQRLIFMIWGLIWVKKLPVRH
jgi:O-antigen ligase